MADPLLGILHVFVVLLGAIVGSFLNVAILRLPEDRSVVRPRSHCPYCGTTLAPRDLVPVLSWLLLRGRCRSCDSPVSSFYPLIEVLTALLAWLLFRRLVPDSASLDGAHLAAWLAFFGFLCLLIVAAYVDLRHWIIPDETSIYAAPLGIAVHAGLEGLGYDGWLALDWRAAVLGGTVGGGLLAAAAVISRNLMRREALGWGDVKLMAMIGAFVGPQQSIFLVLLPASVIGSVVGLLHLLFTRERGYLPFGPFLAIGAASYVFYGDVLARTFLPGIAWTMGL